MDVVVEVVVVVDAGCLMPKQFVPSTVVKLTTYQTYHRNGSGNPRPLNVTSPW